MEYKNSEFTNTQQLRGGYSLFTMRVSAARMPLQNEAVPESNSGIMLSVEREDNATLEDFRTRQLRTRILDSSGRITSQPPMYYLNLARLGERVALSFGASEYDRQDLISKLRETLSETGGTGAIIDVDAPSISSLIWLYPRLGSVKLQREGSYRTFQFKGGFTRHCYEVGETWGGPVLDRPGKLVRVVLESRTPTPKLDKDNYNLPRF